MWAFPGAIFPRTTSVCGAYTPASAPAGQPRRRPGSSTAAAHPGGKPCNQRSFPGSNAHGLPPVFPHIAALLLPPCSPGADRGAVPLPPVREKDPAADGARAGFRDMLRCQRSFQHGIKGQHRRTEIAAICARPAFPQHITGAVQRQAAIVFIVVGAPPYHQHTNRRFFPAGSIHGSCLPPVFDRNCSR